MTSAGLRYCRPATVSEATRWLASEGGAVPLAGGQSLLALLALRRVRPALLVDLEGLEAELGGIRVSGTNVEIGALARQQDLIASPLIREHAPLLAAAARLVASPQVRARGTVGGALAHGDPSAELTPALAALCAWVHISGPVGARAIALDGSGAALDLDAAELVTQIVVPIARPTGWAFEELAGRFAARPLVSAAAVADGGLRVGIGGLTAGPVVLELEASDEPSLAENIEARLGELPAVSDPRAGLSYRRRLAATLGARALTRAAAGERPRPRLGARRPGLRPRGAVRPPSATADLELVVNGQPQVHSVPAGTTLAEVLRERLGLHGTHLGCEHGVCGSCNVLVDGTAVRSCLMLGAQADGRAVTTIEGLRDKGALERLLPAFVGREALQCGFCTPGMLVTLAALAERPANRRALREQLVGNLCRCTGYRPIVDAAEAAL